MHFRSSSKFALALTAALTLGAAAEAGAQVIPRGGKEPAPAPASRVDTVRVMRIDTVTVRGRTDTVYVTRYDTVRMEPAILPVAPRMWGHGLYFGVGGGLSSPNRQFRNYEPGWNATAMLGYDPVAFPLGWRIDASYDQFAERANTANLTADPTLYTVNGDLKLRIPLLPASLNRFAIYGLAGLTYARYKDIVVGPRTNATITTQAQGVPFALTYESVGQFTDKWGWNAGGGAELGIGNSVNLFAESRFISVTWDAEQSYVPIVAGLKFNFGGR